MDINGNYWPCERVPQSEYLKIGNVKEGLNIPKIRRLLDEWVELTKEECHNCWCLHNCKVGCFSNTSDGEKPTQESKLRECAKHRINRHNFLTNYCKVLEQDPTNLDYIEKITVH